MIRIFLPPEQLSPEQIIITGDQARYLTSVLRVKPGESLTIFDGLGFKYSCRIIKCHKKEVVAKRIKKERYSAESSISITLAQGIAKGGRMDLIIQKSTELGVKKIIPLITERSQVRHTHKLDRLSGVSSPDSFPLWKRETREDSIIQA
jgi:16S rRNA (uracil1498-N3)-methyltransferase